MNTDLHDLQDFKVAILGCQRSGTTLMNEILAGGEIFVIEENWIWSYFQRERWHAGGVWHNSSGKDTDEQLIWDNGVKMFISETYGKYYTKKGGHHSKWGIKAPGLNMARTGSYLSKLFPHLSFLILVRDPRDVFASMRKQPKMMFNLPDDFSQSAINSPDLVEIYFKPYAYWGLVYSALEGLVSEVSHRCMVVRYEELMGRPIETIQSVCNFLNLPFKTDLLEPFCRKISNASIISMDYGDYLSGKYVIKKSAVERWKNELSEEDTKELISNIGVTAEKWGYQL